MSRYVVAPWAAGYAIHEVSGIRSTVVARVGSEQMAERIAVLLDRHGLTDTPMGLMPLDAEGGAT